MGILAMLGMAMLVIGGIWLLFVIFSEGGVLWGLGSLIIPFVALIYVAMNWGEAVKKPFLIWLGGWILLFVGGTLGGGMGGT